MSKLYWMSQMIASDSGENIKFAPSTLSGLSSTKVSAAINEAATNKTGIRMSKTLAAGTTSFTFTNNYFTNTMYVDLYSDKELILEEHPVYTDSSKTITYICKELEAQTEVRIVVQF